MSEMLLNGMPFDDYLEKYEIFEKTTQFMMEYLKNWYDDDPKDFQRALRADYRTVFSESTAGRLPDCGRNLSV